MLARRCGWIFPGERPLVVKNISTICSVASIIYPAGIGDLETLTKQLGRPPRGLVGVAVRCPFGRPAVVEQASYLPNGEPFPTTYYLTCPFAVERVGAVEAGGGVDRYERLVAGDSAMPRLVAGRVRPNSGGCGGRRR